MIYFPKKTAVAVAAVLALNSCGSLQPFVDDITMAIDDAIRAFETSSANFEDIARDFQESLPGNVPAYIDGLAKDSIAYATASAQGQVQCAVDILGRRATDALRAARNRYVAEEGGSLMWLSTLFGPKDPPPPLICDIVPESVDLNSEGQNWLTVTVFGYRLGALDNQSRQLSYAIYAENGEMTSVPVSFSSRYEAKINLSARMTQEALLAAGDGAELAFTWNGQRQTETGETPVLPWTPRPLDWPTKEYVSGWYELTRTDGDCDIDSDDEEVLVTFAAALRRETRLLGAEMHFEAVEQDDDDDEETRMVDKDRLARFFELDRGFAIESVSPAGAANLNERYGENIGRDIKNSPKTVSFGGDSAVGSLQFELDRSGAGGCDDGYAKYRVIWGPLKVTYRETVPEWLR